MHPYGEDRGKGRLIMSATHIGLAPPPTANKLAGIDATRGWAIFLVIAVHSLGLVPDLPWPAVRVISFGWYGVQLFFIASAFTLL
jgi:peptidoglycan/LPS O-acetylase OafA/YrhL